MPRLALPLAVLFLCAAGCSSDGDSIPCSDPAPTGCYEFSGGSCSAVDAQCVDDSWRCTTPEDYAAMMIACETGPLLDGGF